MRRGRQAAAAGAVSLSLMLAATAAAGAEGPSLALAAGRYDIGKRSGVAEAGVEYRLASRAYDLVPVAGVAANGDGAFWAYGGLQRPFRLGTRWRLTPGFAVALYEAGSDGKDLGGVVEFRSSLALGYRFAGGSTLGLTAHHLSNAGLYEDNPGSNSVVVTWSFPFSP